MRLTKDQNVARGYAVYTPNGRYVKPACMNPAMKTLVDQGYVKVSDWGKVEVTNKWNDDINSVPKPTFQAYSEGDFIDRALSQLLLDDMNALSIKIAQQFPQAVNSVAYLLDEKPAQLVAMETELNEMFNNYWTPERRAVEKANVKAKNDYEVAILRIEQARKDVISRIAKAEDQVARAIERNNNPVMTASQKKIAEIIADKKASTAEKTEAILEGKSSGNASTEAKRSLVVQIATLIHKGFTKDAIFELIKDQPIFTALAYKKAEKTFEKLYKDTVAWHHHINQIKVFYDLKAHVIAAMSNTRIQKDTKTQLPLILTMIALHQAKDNSSRGLVAYRYLTRITLVSSPLLSLDYTKIGRKLETYAKHEYINYAKGVQGGIPSRAGLTGVHTELSKEELAKADEIILNSFQQSPFYSQLERVLSLINSKPAYGDTELENAVAELLEVFTPLTRAAADERIAERAIESVDFEAAKETYVQEQTDRITAHIASGKGFQAKRLQTTT